MSTLIVGPKNTKTLFMSSVAQYLEPHGINPDDLISIEIKNNPTKDYVVSYLKDGWHCVLTVSTSVWSTDND